VKSQHDYRGEERAARKRYLRANKKVRVLHRKLISERVGTARTPLRDAFNAAFDVREQLGHIWTAKQDATYAARGGEL
jgi:hypothetical protein